MKQSLETRIQKEEAKDKRTSGIITGVVVLIILIISMFWKAFSGPVPPIEDEQFISTGRIDFGNWTNGSSDVNNFQDPSPNPSEQPKSTEQPKEVENQPKETVSQATEKIASPDSKSETTVPKVDKPTNEDNSTKANQTPEKDPNENRKPSEESMFELTEDGEDGGSNHGDGDDVGNRGRPDTRVLDPDGLFSWGNGGDGLGGRYPIDLPKPVYNSAQDALLTFKFEIRPDGSVGRIIDPMTEYDELIEAGKKAIRKWKFNQVPSNAKPTWTKVTIKFFRR